MGIDWGKAGLTGLIGFAGVYAILLVLQLAVTATFKLLRAFHAEPADGKEKGKGEGKGAA